MFANWRDLEFDEIPEWPIKVQNIVLMICVIVTFGLAYWFVYIPLNEQLLDAKQQEDDLKLTLRAKAIDAVKLEYLDQLLMTLESQFDDLNKQLPAKTELAELLSGINETGLRYNLEFKQLNWQPEIEENWSSSIPLQKIVSVPLQMVLHGKYQDIGYFSSELANLERVIAFNEFTLARIRKESDEDLKFNVTAYTYRHDFSQEVAK